MNQSLNPWLTSPATYSDSPDAVAGAYLPPAARISAPLLGMVEPDAADRLGRRAVSGTATA